MDVKLLEGCGYEVTVFGSKAEALEGLHDEKDRFEFYISDENGVKKIENLSVSDDVPVIMVSKGSEASRRGVCICLVKPMKILDMWRIVHPCIREKTANAGDIEVDVINKSTEKRRIKSGEGIKKKRIQWGSELHQKFVMAVQQQGIDTTPKRILEFMALPGLTRDQVASHLQKYRRNYKPKDDSGTLIIVDAPKDSYEIPTHLHAPNNHNSFNGLSTTPINQNPTNHSSFEPELMILENQMINQDSYHQVPHQYIRATYNNKLLQDPIQESKVDLRYQQPHGASDSYFNFGEFENGENVGDSFLVDYGAGASSDIYYSEELRSSMDHGTGSLSDIIANFSKEKGSYEDAKATHVGNNTRYVCASSVR